MSASSLPDFDHTLRLSQGSLDAPDLAECHGLLCGMVCRESSRTPRDFLDQLSAMELVVRPGQALNAALADAWRSTVEQLADEDMGFTLWLPDDEEPLEDRTVALAQWCSGFLAGLGSAGPLEALSDEAREAIADLQEIARAEPDLDLDPDFDPIVDLSRLVERERDRSGPGTAARRALEALAESRRLREQLDDLEDFDSEILGSGGSRADG